MEKSAGYLGRVKSNFLGTEFLIEDTGVDYKGKTDQSEMKAQQGVVQYETNVLGSKGPRRMKVLLPNVDLACNQAEWRSTDVSAYLIPDY